MLKKSKKTIAESKVSNSPVTKVDRTIIGDQIFIEGVIRGEEDLLIEGSVKGSIEMTIYSWSLKKISVFSNWVFAGSIVVLIDLKILALALRNFDKSNDSEFTLLVSEFR